MTQQDSLTLIELEPISSVQLKNLKWVVCIDTSGSTDTAIAPSNQSNIDTNTNISSKYKYISDKYISNKNTILKCEISFVKKIITKIDKTYESVSFIEWNSTAGIFSVDTMDYIISTGGTDPACMFNNTNTMSAINNADAMMILTDGEISQREVTQFGKKMLTMGCHLKAIIGVLVGKKHNTSNCPTPERVPFNSSELVPFNSSELKPAQIDVSVLVPAMISDSCILYHDSSDTYVMWASGAFKTTWNPVDIVPETKWEEVTNLKNYEDTKIMNICVNNCDPLKVQELRQKGYIPIGQNKFFNANILLASTPSWEELKTYPFDRICQYFKVTGQYQQLIEWFKSQKERFLETLLIDPEEKLDFDNMLSRMIILPPGGPGAITFSRPEYPVNFRPTINNNIMSSFLRERNNTIARRYVATDEDIDFALGNPEAIQLMRFFRDMMQVMQEDIVDAGNAQNNYSQGNNAYSVSSISATRYSSCMNNNISDNNSLFSNKCKTITARFNEPYTWHKQFKRACPDYKGYELNFECSICNEMSEPFILLRKKINKRKVNKLETYPLEYYYPSLLCKKCADYFCHMGKDPVRVPCIAALPLIRLDRVNDVIRKSYLQEFSSLTNQVNDYLNLESNEQNKFNYKKSLYNFITTPIHMIGNILGKITQSIYSMSYSDDNDNDDNDDNDNEEVKNDNNDIDKDENEEKKQSDIFGQSNEIKILTLLTVLLEQMKKQFHSQPEEKLIIIFMQCINDCKNPIQNQTLN